MTTKLSIRYLLYLVVACGFSILVLEFTCVTFLEPYLGKNTVIWANMISLVMIALCLGYLLGGRLARHAPTIETVLTVIGLSGAYLMGLPWVGAVITKYYLTFSSTFMTTKMAAYLGSFILPFFLFGPPLLGLAIIEPYIIALYSTRSDRIGSQVGRIFSLATLGGLVGLYTTTLYLIPTFGSKPTLVIIGTLLLLSAVKPKITRAPFFLLSMGCMVLITISITQPIVGPINFHAALSKKKLGPRYSRFEREIPRVIYEKETLYQYLQIAETTHRLWLFLGSSSIYYQSIFQKDSVITGGYYDYFSILPDFLPHKDPLDVLILGLAGGSISRLYLQFYPTMRIDGVEIDTGVINASKQFFELEQPGLTIINADGRQFLNYTNKQYDIIILDAFSQEYYVPWHLSSKECFTLIRNHLKKDGLFAMNIVPLPGLKEPLENTLTAVFPYVYNHDKGERPLRKHLLATNQPLYHYKEKRIEHPLLSIYAKLYFNSSQRVQYRSDAPILTDDKNPLEFFVVRHFWKTLLRF